jgi:tetratricopeptide (TPR) repeat protein
MAAVPNPRPHTALALAAVCAVIGTAVVAGCSTADTPGCDRAATLARQTKLTAAAEAYAQAARDHEGQCATDGSAAVAKTQAEALTDLARGQAAEKAGDLTGARTAYQAALALDAGNSDATAGLARVTHHPATLNPLWLPVQRLHDEGYDDAARTQIIAILKAHPDQTVPESLTTLRPTPTPTPTAVITTTPRRTPTESTASTPGWLIAVLAASLLILAAVGAATWYGWRQLRSQLEAVASTNATLDRQLQAANQDVAVLARQIREQRLTSQALQDAAQSQRSDLATLTRSLDDHEQAILALAASLESADGQPTIQDYAAEA